MRPHAEQAAREIGVDPDALLAQAALETGWGRSVPCNANGECSFNLFGIKAGSQWSGATVNVPTLEFESGIPVRKVERFRAYGSPADSFRDYAALIRDSSRYASARGAGDNVEAFASALQQGGYATDPNYAQKITAVADEVRARSDALKFAATMPSTTTAREIF
jgi:flagellar protein FlgJ